MCQIWPHRLQFADHHPRLSPHCRCVAWYILDEFSTFLLTE